MTTDTHRSTSADRDVVRLMHEVDRYRTATEDALEQLDWCIGYFFGSNKKSIARALGANRSRIRTNIRRDPQSVPAASSSNGRA